jgi:hypothetical protein
MKAEREWFDPAKRSILAKTSPDSVIDVFSFILLIHHPRTIQANRVAPARICDFALASDRRIRHGGAGLYEILVEAAGVELIRVLTSRYVIDSRKCHKG